MKSPNRWMAAIAMALAMGSATAYPALAQDEAKAQDPPADAKKTEGEAGAKPAAPAVPTLPGPESIPEVKVAPNLPTFPVNRNKKPGPNEIVIDSSRLPRDKSGIWVMDFMFKPVRMRVVDVPGKGRKQIYYLWYRVINRTGSARLFVPQFTLVTDTGKSYDDTVIPQAVKVIQAREDGLPLRGAIDIIGVVPPSTKSNVDDAVYGVAVFQDVDPKTDKFSVYVRGLSDGYQLVDPPKPAASAKTTQASAQKVSKFKTLRIDFTCPGDEFDKNEDEIHLVDPPYEWIYWAPGVK